MSALETTAALVPPHGRQQMLRALATDPRSAAGLVLVGLVIVAALCAPLLAPFDPELPDFASTLAPPTARRNQRHRGVERAHRDLPRAVAGTADST